MTDCEIGNRFPVANVDERLLLRSRLPEEETDGVSVEGRVKDVRLVLRPSAETRVSVDRGAVVMDYSANAARALADEAGLARSGEESPRGSRVGANGVFGFPEPEAGAGKGEQGNRHFTNRQSMAEIGSAGEVVEAKQEAGQTRVSPWHGSRSEVAEARESWMHGFEVGDMVWGKVKSHPWWPGHIYNEAFASSSVRRAKREGHALVAFFGDSSYGWFDTAELIPFGPHYAEKSKQTTSRNFTKAVEEAVDEASRRCALGLSCCCRNPSNFRPTSVPGYVIVDVAGYEPGGVYSSKQIRKARDDFVTAEVLSFVNQLAVMPQDSEQGSFDLIKKTATLLALRKAMFEEFDVTYAEAFGVQPVLPSRATQGGSEQQGKVPFRAAPLSGPLVIAEALGERKTSSKAVVRAKDSSSAKKNKYLFKRREDASPGSSLKSTSSAAAAAKKRSPSSAGGELPEPNVHYIPHGPADVVVAAADGSYAAEVGNYVLQKREPEKQLGIPAKQGAGRASVAPESRGFSPESQDRAAEPGGRSMAPVRDAGVKPEVPGGEEVGARALPVHEYKPAVDAKEAVGLKVPGVVADAEAKLRFPQPGPEQGKDAEQAVGFTGVAAYGAPLPMDADVHHRRAAKATDGVVKKVKVRKHPPGELDGEKQKKKRKIKEGGLEASADHPTLKHRKNGESLRLSAGKSIGIGLAASDNSLAEPEMKADGAHTSFAPSDSAILQQLPNLDLVSQGLDLPAVLGDLSALALDPFYGAERNVPAIVRYVLLRFRSLVYEKALRSPPTGDHEASEPHAAKMRPARPPQEAGKDTAGASREGEAREPRDPTKPPKMKGILKQEDPTKMGRKRLPSDRQEEKLAKRLKKLDKLKALASEKKAALVGKASAAHPRGEQRDAAGPPAVAPAKFPKADSVIKKQEAPNPPKVATPTYLVMKFPQRTTLPSISSLKARFARFGPLDLSGTRVFWKSYSCKVLFKHKPDAQSAYDYAQNNDIFGLVKVLYFLRELESPAPDSAAATDPAKRPAAEARPEGGPQQFGAAAGVDLAADLKPKHQTVYSGQLKSILKKPNGDEAAPAGGAGVTKEAPRVKFMLGGDDGRGEPPVVVSSSNNNGGSSNSGGFLPNPPLLDLNNRKAPKTVTFLQPLQPPLQPPLRPSQEMQYPIPLAPPLAPRVAPPDALGPRGALQFGKVPHYPVRFGEVEARERGGGGGGVDISHQMLSLLARCSDIVTSVKSALGYVPYHPL